MKQLFSLLFLLIALFAQSAWAQELTIKSFAQSATDITASTESRLDGNGDPCALVKVGLPLVGATFEGEIVGPVASHNGEYWVYMVAGSKRLIVKQQSVLPLTVLFADHGVTGLEAKCTYQLMLLPTQLGLGQVQQDDGMTYVLFAVNPTNAILTIDGDEKTLNDQGEWTKRLPRGHHSYEVKAKGYVTKSGTFELGLEKLPFSVSLESTAGTVAITCPTPGAEIYVDDQRYASNSSWSGPLAPDNYYIEARKEGYYPQSKSITVGARQQLNVTLPALVPRVGSLDVSYTPLNAEVWLDGQKLGTTPDLFRNIIAGTHQVEIRKEGFQTASQRIIIEEGKTATLSGSLEKTSSSTVAATTTTSSSSDIFNGHAYVDLGLKDAQGRTIYWATCNVGAEKPEDAGLYFAWGETVGYGFAVDKNSYESVFHRYTTNDGRKFDSADYKWCRGSYETMTKYCKDSKCGTVDNKTVLDLEDDAAHVNWGGGWRMPTKAEQNQLRKECTWTWDETKKGHTVKGPNGNSIFLPAAGYRSIGCLDYAGSYGNYWSSSLGAGNSGTAYYLYFNSYGYGWRYGDRYYGHSVRPVCQ